MPRGKMSAEARAKIAAAQRKRWAKVRAAKAEGSIAPARRGPGRPPKSAPASIRNKYLDMPIMQLIVEKRQIDEAWKAVQRIVQRA